MKSSENSKNAIKTRILEDAFGRPKGARKIFTTAKPKKKALAPRLSNLAFCQESQSVLPPRNHRRRFQ